MGVREKQVHFASCTKTNSRPTRRKGSKKPRQYGWKFRQRLAQANVEHQCEMQGGDPEKPNEAWAHIFKRVKDAEVVHLFGRKWSPKMGSEFDATKIDELSAEIKKGIEKRVESSDRNNPKSPKERAPGGGFNPSRRSGSKAMRRRRHSMILESKIYNSPDPKRGVARTPGSSLRKKIGSELKPSKLDLGGKTRFLGLKRKNPQNVAARAGKTRGEALTGLVGSGIKKRRRMSCLTPNEFAASSKSPRRRIANRSSTPWAKKDPLEDNEVGSDVLASVKKARPAALRVDRRERDCPTPQRNLTVDWEPLRRNLSDSRRLSRTDPLPKKNKATRTKRCLAESLRVVLGEERKGEFADHRPLTLAISSPEQHEFAVEIGPPIVVSRGPSVTIAAEQSTKLTRNRFDWSFCKSLVFTPSHEVEVGPSITIPPAPRAEVPPPWIADLKSTFDEVFSSMDTTQSRMEQFQKRVTDAGAKLQRVRDKLKESRPTSKFTTTPGKLNFNTQPSAPRRATPTTTPQNRPLISRFQGVLDKSHAFYKYGSTSSRKRRMSLCMSLQNSLTRSDRKRSRAGFISAGDKKLGTRVNDRWDIGSLVWARRKSAEGRSTNTLKACLIVALTNFELKQYEVCWITCLSDTGVMQKCTRIIPSSNNPLTLSDLQKIVKPNTKESKQVRTLMKLHRPDLKNLL